MKRILPFVFMLTFSLGSFSQTNQTITVASSEDNATMYSIRLNSVSCEDLIMFTYQRLLPANEKLAVSLRAGFMIWDPVLPLAEVGLVTGGPKHFFETGLGVLLDPIEGGGFFTVRAGYRYQAPQGFLFKLSGIYSPDNFILPLIGVGYAF